MRDLGELFARLARSRFRQSMALSRADRDYLARQSLVKLLQHAQAIIRQRLAPAQPARDGRQTPWRGHPVFTAQHATATCCRACLAQWHAIPQGIALSEEDVVYVVDVIQHWWRLHARSEWQAALDRSAVRKDAPRSEAKGAESPHAIWLPSPATCRGRGAGGEGSDFRTVEVRQTLLCVCDVFLVSRVRAAAKAKIPPHPQPFSPR